MFFPIRTDRAQRYTPWLNYALIAANVVAFLVTRDQINSPRVAQWFLQPQHPQWWQFFTYQFLHANFMHLGSNMLFLYVFGNSIEDRFGKVGYLFFYLAGGVFAGIGHILSSNAPVLGASGSVAGVTGAYLALFPMTYVTIVYFFVFIGTFEVASMWLILLQVAQNFVFYVGETGGHVAYGAHLVGYGYGFIIGVGMLAVRLLPREPYDMLSMLDHRRRRAQFRSAAAKGYKPWEFNKPGDPPSAVSDTPSPATPEEERIFALRSRISGAIRDHNLNTAVDLYAQLLKIDPKQVLGQQQQLDLANQLMSAQQYADAAAAYERFLSTYASYSQREQVQLILALIYARYLERRQRARELLDAALPRLHDGEQKSLAQEIIDELGPR